MANEKETKQTVANYTDEERDAIVARETEQYWKMIKEGKYKDLLLAVGKNDGYSLKNVLFMLSQRPDLSVAKGMNEWEKNGRHIKEGAKSMEIMAPTRVPYTVAVKDEKGNPKLDENGNEIVLQRERTQGFHPMYVFDLADTEGETYKPYKIKAKISDTEKKNILDGIFSALSAKHLKYKFTDESEFGENETYKIDRKEKTVKIRKGMGNTETALTAIEAASKAICDNYKGNSFEGMLGDNAESMEAASRGCILAASFGLDTKNFNFDYMKELNDEQIGLFENNLAVVCSGTKLVIDRIGRAFYKDQQARAEAAPAVTDDEVIAEREPFQPDRAKQAEIEAA